MDRGAFGWAYLAVRENDHRRVAIKVARASQPHAAERLRSETSVLVALGPPTVPEVYHADELADGSPFVVMEYIGLPTLASILADNRELLTIEDWGVLADAIAASLEHVHEFALVHRDLKPEHIFLDSESMTARLIDFGLAKLASQSPTLADLTVPGAIIGTPEYMAPEQCVPNSTLDERTDVYAFGVIAYETLTGRPPFFGPRAEVQEAHRSRRPPRPSSSRPMPSAIEEFVLRCLAKDPSDRYATGTELRAALHLALDQRSPVTGTFTPLLDDAPAVPRASSQTPQQVVMLWFESSRSFVVIKRLLDHVGGTIAHQVGNVYAVVFDHQAGRDPARRAVHAARRLAAGRLSKRLVADIAPVKVFVRPDDSRHYFCVRSDRWGFEIRPAQRDGLVAMPRVAQLLDDTAMEVLPDRDSDARFIELGVRKHAPNPGKSAGKRPLFGRQPVLDDLMGSARRAIALRAPGIATVVAETGYGKSHLFAALRGRLRESMPLAEVIDVRAPEPIDGSASEILQTVLWQALGLRGMVSPDTSLETVLNVMADHRDPNLFHEVWIGIALIFGWLSPEARSVRRKAVAPGALRSLIARTVARVLCKQASRKPVLLVLDDAQYADQTTLDALELAALADVEAALWICVLVEPSFERTRPEWGKRAAEHQRARLGPLDREAANALCRVLLHPADRIPAGAIDRLIDRSEGIPLFLVELIKGLKAERLVRRQVNGSWYVATDEIDRLPNLPVVEWLAMRELESMPAELAAHARLTALLGAEITLEEIAGVVRELDKERAAEQIPLDPTVATKRLVARRLLLPHDDSSFRFRYSLIRDEICSQTPKDLQQTVHRAAYRYYQTPNNSIERRRLSRLAFHASRSGHGAQAAAVYRDLAERACSHHEYLSAEALYSLAIAQLDESSDTERLACYRGRSLMRYRLNRYQDALVDFELARTLAAFLGDRHAEAEILLDQAIALDWCDKWQESQKCVEMAQDLVDAERSPLIEARLLLGRGRSACRQSRDEEAAALLARAIELAGSLEDEAYETYVIALLLNGYILATLDRLDESEACFDRVVPLCEGRGDQLHLAAALGNRSILWLAKNRYDRLILDLERLRDLAQELGQDRMEQHAHYHLAQHYHWIGDEYRAERHARRAMAVDEQRFSDASRQESALMVARILALRGRSTEAREVLAAIRDKHGHARDDGSFAIDLIPFEEALYAMVELTADAGHDTAAWQALDKKATSSLPLRERIELLELWALSAARAGEQAEATERLEKSVRLAESSPGLPHERRVRTALVRARVTWLGDPGRDHLHAMNG